MQNLQGHSSAFQFSILDFKTDRDANSFVVIMQVFQIFGPKEVMVLAPYLAELYKFLHDYWF